MMHDVPGVAVPTRGTSASPLGREDPVRSLSASPPPHQDRGANVPQPLHPTPPGALPHPPPGHHRPRPTASGPGSHLPRARYGFSRGISARSRLHTLLALHTHRSPYIYGAELSSDEPLFKKDHLLSNTFKHQDMVCSVCRSRVRSSQVMYMCVCLFVCLFVVCLSLFLLFFLTACLSVCSSLSVFLNVSAI